jgi:glycosyltransferase involved in cell wall biosynthesis/O-antigen/teichoic acid export membrane protein
VLAPPRIFRRDALALLVSLGIMNASNYAFHLIVSRSLGPGEYGALSSLLAVLLVMSVPLNTLQTVVAKRTAELRGAGRAPEIPALSFAAVRVLGPLAVVVSLGLAAIAPLVGLLLDVGLVSAALLAMFALISLVLAVPLGVLQGQMRFGALATVLLAGAVCRLLGAVLLLDLGWGLEGALFATVLAPVVSLVLARRFLRERGVGRRERRSWNVTLLRGQFRQTLWNLGAFWTLAGFDVILARHYLGPQEAGFYSSAALIARSFLFLGGAVSMLAFPWFVRTAAKGREAARSLWLALAITAGLVLASLPPLLVWKETVVRLAFGPGFVPAADLVPVLAIAMGILAIAHVLVYFCIAHGVRAHAILLPAVALEVAAVSVAHGSAQSVETVLLAVAAAVTAALGLAAWATCRSSRGADERRALEAELGGAGAPTADVEERPNLSVVMPCHNGGRALREMLQETVEVLSGTPPWEIVLVSDGSTDDTEEIARGFADRGVRLIAYPERRGKGAAVRIGLAAARGKYVAFIDADGDIEPEAFTAFLRLVDLYEPDAVVGSKRHPLSHVDYPPLRRLLSWAFHLSTRLLFRLNVRDTQTGMKLFRSDVLADVLPRVRDDGYTFDLELLVVAARRGYRRIFEAPVRVGYRSASHVGFGTPFRMASSTVALFLRRYVLDTYGGSRPAPESSPNADAESPAPVGDVGEATGSPLRILILNWRDVVNPQAGGAELFSHEVAKRWVGWGHHVTLLTSRFPGGRPEETIDGVVIRRVGVLRRGSLHLLVQRELSRLRGFDVVIDEINTIPFLTPVWSESLPPIVGMIHQLAADVWDAEMPRPLAAIGRRTEPRLLRMYRDVPVVTISGSTSEDLRRLGLRDVRLILQGRDEPPLLTVPKEEVPTFLFVGRLAANKRPGHALAAIDAARDRLPGARLWVVGEGAMEATLRERAGDGIEILGRIPREELYERMARAHCLLVPSVREGWGMVITEANAVGTPAAGYDVPGIRDAIRPSRTGLLAPAGDAASLGRLAADLVLDRERYERMCAEAVTWGRCFSWDVTAELFLEIVHDRVRSSATRGMEAVGAELAATG